jgi:LemA protein
MIGLTLLIWLIVTLAVVIVLGYIIVVYNSLIRLRNDMDKSWANIDVLLKQRSEELPNLIAAVKGYMKHEKETLLAITKARTELLGAQTLSAKAKADKVISGALKTLFAAVENYPNLKANENFLKLQGRITEIENSIADRREFFNDAVTTFNTTIESFPDMYIANMMKCTRRDLFKATEEEKKVVSVAMDQ